MSERLRVPRSQHRRGDERHVRDEEAQSAQDGCLHVQGHRISFAGSHWL